MKKLLLLVGTKKGLFTFTSPDRTRWKLDGPHLSGKEVNHAIYDPRTKRLHATANDAWFGSEISEATRARSSDRVTKAIPGTSGTKLARRSLTRTERSLTQVTNGLSESSTRKQT